MVPLFYEAPTLSGRALAVLHEFEPVFEATVEESRAHRAKIEDAMTASGCLTDLTYGEVDVKGFLAILDCVEAIRREEGLLPQLCSFVDLGCGLGKAVWLAAAYWPSVASARGLDLNDALVADAQRLSKKYLPVIVSCRAGDASELHVAVDCADVCDDMVKWENADIVFTYWNAMSETVKRVIAQRARSLKPGGIVVTTRQAIPGTDPHCCPACRLGCVPECAQWRILRHEWMDFERLPHETVIIQAKR
jgi:SAM-dependent methyltransferase